MRDRTLWQAVLDYLKVDGSASRRAVLEEFSRDDPVNVGSVINDLVASGLVSRTGTGDATIYALTRESDLGRRPPRGAPRIARAPLLGRRSTVQAA